ncbi:hypothetical protein FOPE_00185 [Fonsecaea pedrosoi]|nr:hypothetical protein FOPE_00185 [Fonsecaea pedrosoi]
MLEGLEAFVGSEYLSEKDIQSLRTAHRDAISSFTQCVDPIIEAFGFTDTELNSVFTRKDRTPYEALWDIAQKSQLSDNSLIRPTILRARSLWRNYQGSRARM